MLAGCLGFISCHSSRILNVAAYIRCIISQSTTAMELSSLQPRRCQYSPQAVGSLYRFRTLVGIAVTSPTTFQRFGVAQQRTNRSKENRLQGD